MALTEAQINKIAKILGVTKRTINAQISALGADLTAQDETDIAAELARWDAGAGTNYVSFAPTESNRGFTKKASSEQSDIRRNLRILLDFDAPPYSSGIGTIKIGC
jgi:hypothetical protein